MTEWRRRLTIGRRDVASEVDDEVAHHLDELRADLEAQGMSPAQARAEAARRFGDATAVRQATRREAAQTDRRTRRLNWLGEVGQDLRFAFRQARRQPGFILLLLLVLALGIGAHTTIATAFHAVLLRPLPYAQPERLVHLWETAPDLLGGRSEASYPDFEDWRAETRDLFAGLEGYDETNMSLTGSGSARMLQGARITTGFLPLLGVHPSLGRPFRDGEDLPGGTPVVLLGHAFWRTDFGGDPSVLGRTITLNGRGYEVVGVLPKDFHFARFANANILIPLDRAAETRAQRSNHWLRVVGRLRDDVTLEQAHAGMTIVMARLARDDPGMHATRTSLVVPLREELTGRVRPVLLALGAAVVVLLLVACANAGSLLLARGLVRAPELRLRTALGAGRGRLARQLVTEAVAIAVVAGALGAGLAHVGLPLLVRAIPSGVLSGLPALQHLAVDWRILAWTLAVSLLTGIAFGVLPGLGMVRRLVPGQHRTGRGASLRDALVVGELAMTVVLLVIAGLLTRSLTSLVESDAGFRPDRVVTFRFSLSGESYQAPGRQQGFIEELLARIRRVPGVTQAGAVTSLPLQGGGTNTFRVEGRLEPPPGQRPEVTMRGVAGDYFATMGIRLVAGRALGGQDAEGQPPALMLDESTARRLFGSPDAALGERLRFYAFPDQPWTVVGVAGDVRSVGLDEAAPATAYYSHLQVAENRMSVVALVTASDGTVLASARQELESMDPAVPFYAPETMRERITNSPAVFLRRYPLILIGGFAAVALALAVAGLYAVLAFLVASRAREFGVRAALGATPGALVAMIVRRTMILAGTGLGLGIVLALAVSHGVARLFYGVAPGDPLTFAAVTVGLVAVTVAAAWAPARRTARLSPLDALRHD